MWVWNSYRFDSFLHGWCISAASSLASALAHKRVTNFVALGDEKAKQDT
jgi:hypothetical protein